MARTSDDRLREAAERLAAQRELERVMKQREAGARDAAKWRSPSVQKLAEEAAQREGSVTSTPSSGVNYTTSRALKQTSLQSIAQQAAQRQTNLDYANNLMSQLPAGSYQSVNDAKPVEKKQSFGQTLLNMLISTPTRMGDFSQENTAQIRQMDEEQRAGRSKVLQEQYGMPKSEADRIAQNWSSYQQANAVVEQDAYKKRRQEWLDNEGEEKVDLMRQLLSGRDSGYTGVAQAFRSYDQDLRDKFYALGLDENSDEFKLLRQYVGEIMDEERTQTMQGDIRNFVDQYKVGGVVETLGGIGATLGAGPLAAVESLRALGYADKTAPINTNSPLYALQNYKNAAYGATGEEIREDIAERGAEKGLTADEIEKKQNRATFAYNVATSTAESAMLAYIGKGVAKAAQAAGLSEGIVKALPDLVTLPIFSTSAYSQTVQDAQARGISKDKAVLTGVFAGVAESLFEKMSLDAFYAKYAASSAGKIGLKKTITNLLSQSGIEGSEEVFTEIANILSDAIINQDYSELMTRRHELIADGKSVQEAERIVLGELISQIGEAGLAGAISGGIMGGLATGTGQINYHNTAKAVKTNAELTDKILETAKTQMDEDSTARKIAEEKTSETISDKELSQVLQSMNEVANVQEEEGGVENLLAKEFESLGESEEQAAQDAKRIMEIASTEEEDITDESEQALTEEMEQNENLAPVMGQYLRGETGGVINAVNAVNAEMKAQEQQREAQKQAEKEQRKVERQIRRSSINNMAQVTMEDGKPGVAVRFESVKAGETPTVRMGDGRVLAMSEFTADTKENAELWQRAARMEDTAAANAMLEDYHGNSMSDLMAYDLASYEVYSMGRVGALSFDQVMEDPDIKYYAHSIDPAHLRTMYELGANAAKASKVEEAPAQLSPKATDIGTVTDNRSNASEDTIYQLAEMVAEKTGVNISLKDSVGKDTNGSFVSAFGRIALGTESGNEYGTLQHELSEFGRAYAPKKMQLVIDKTMQYVQSQEGAEALTVLLDNYKKTYRQMEKGKTIEQSADEFTFDYIAGLMMTEQGQKDFQKWLSKNATQSEKRSIAQTLADIFDKIVDMIHQILETAHLNPATRQALRAEEKAAKEIRDLWFETIDEASANLRQQAKEKTGEDAKETDQSEARMLKVFSESEIKELAETNIKKVANMDSVEYLARDIFSDKSRPLSEQVNDFFKAIHNTAFNDLIGDVDLTFRGIKDDISHGKMTRAKAITFKAIPTVIKDGMLIDFQKNYKGRNYDTVVFAAPVKYENPKGTVSECLVGVSIIRKEEDGNQRFYLHNALILPEGATPLSKTGVSSISGNNDPGDDAPSIFNLLLKAYSYKTKTVKSLEIKEDSAGRELSEGQQTFYADESPLLLNANGALKRYYHGTARMDRVGTVFDPARATSGPMAFFTDNKSIAENYARGKNDTSLSRDPRYDSYYTQFRLNIGGKDLSVPEAWDKLPYSKKEEIRKKAGHIAFDDDYEEIMYYPDRTEGNGAFTQYELKRHHGNYLETLVDTWLETGDLWNREEDFLKVLELVGIEGAEYLDPDARNEGVYEVYLHITNPLDTSNISKKTMQALKKAAKNATFDQFAATSDAWDKNSKRPEEWIERLEEDVKNGTTYSWTSIPDWVSDTLRVLGFDGIVDTGGKYGGDTHQVVIPFSSEQVKNIDNLNPTTNPDINYSLRVDSQERELSDDQALFFGGSRVRDDQGRLLVMYHGTDTYNEFTVFKPGKYGYLGKGIYFSESEDYARRYAEKNGYDGRIYQVYLNVKNPLIVTSENPAVEILGEKVARSRGLKNSYSTRWITPADIKKLQNRGYDGIIWQYGSTPMEVSVWNANQIKLTTNEHPTVNEDIRYSINVTEDSDGRELSKGQQKYFANSKVRDAEGRLMVMYHGTSSGGFTVFDPSMSDDKLSLFFTNNEEVAKSYALDEYTHKFDPYREEVTEIKDAEAAREFLEAEGYTYISSYEETRYGKTLKYWSFMIPGVGMSRGNTNKQFIEYAEAVRSSKERYFETYLNIKNPLVINAHGGFWNKLQGLSFGYEYGSEKVISVTFTKKNGKYEVESKQIDNPGLWGYEDIVDTFGEEFAEIVKNAPKKVTFDNLYVNFASKICLPNGTRTAALMARYGGNDGVIIEDVKDYAGGFGKRKHPASTVAIAFNSNQVKSVDNLHPTENEDIRYSLKVDSEGHDLSEGQQRYFARSMVRDAEGRLKVMYHGTPIGGFNIFEFADDGISFFFTDKLATAESYSGVPHAWNHITPITLDELNEALWNLGGTSEEDEVFKKNGNKYEYWSMEGELTLERTFDTLRDAQNYFIDKYVEPLAYQGVGSPMNYEVYLNATNPLVYDAKGQEWDALEPIGYARRYSNVEITPTDDGRYEVEYEEKGRYQHKIFTAEELDRTFGEKTAENATFRWETFSASDHSENIYIGKDGTRMPSNTRELAKYAKDHGYDSLIIDNVRDSGGYAANNEPSQVVVVFNPNQIKSIYNENPTEDPDIRYSMSVWGDEIDSELQKDLDEANSILREGMNALGDLELDKKVVDRIADSIRRDYGTTMSKKDIADRISKVFAYLQETGSNSKEDLMRIMREVAEPILEEMEPDPELMQTYKDFKDFFKGKRIKLTSKQAQEVRSAYGSTQAFRNAMWGNGIIFANDGIPLDSFWNEIVAQSQGHLDLGTNEGDMPIALADFMNALKPGRMSYKDMGMEDAPYDLALDIYRRYFEERAKIDGADDLIKAEAEKIAAQQQAFLKKQVDKYKKSYQDAMKSLEKERQANIARLAQEINEMSDEEKQASLEGDLLGETLLKAQREKYEERLKDLREQKDEKIALIKAQAQVARRRQADARKLTEYKAILRKQIDDLNAMLAHPTESKHIPVDMVNAVINVLEAINIDTGSQTTRQKLDRLAALYEKYRDNESVMMDYDERTAANIQRLKQIFDGRNYTQLYSNELWEVNDILRALKVQIRNANKLLGVERFKYAREASQTAIKEVEESKKSNGTLANMLDTYATAHLNSRRFFRKIFGYRDGSGMALWQGLDDGQQRMMNIQREVSNIFANVVEGKENQKRIKDLVSTKPEDLVDIGLTDENGLPVKVSKAMRLSLLMHVQNASNMRHILRGGLTVPDMDLYSKNIQEAYARGKTYRFVDTMALLEAAKNGDTATVERMLGDAEKKIRDLYNDLSDWEKAYLADAEEFFHNYTGDLINQTSLALKGYAIARVRDYFPIKTDASFVKQDFSGLVQDASLEGMGMLKERVMSSKPILLEDISNVIARQTRNVSMYAGMAVPLRNLNMVLNHTFIDSQGNLRSLKQALKNTWGANNEKYMQDLMQDIQGGRSQDNSPLGHFMDKLRGNYAGAVLTLNPSVAIKQSASYPTAAAIVGWKPLLKAIKDVGKGFAKGVGLEKLEERNPLLWYRGQGYASQEMADAKRSGLMSKLPKALKWVEFMDIGTVRTLEYAAKYYVDEQGVYKEGTDAYWNEVSRVFTRIVEETQPNYTPLQQAGIIRNPNKFLKQIIMFKTQPMQNFSIVYDAAMNLNAQMRYAKEGKDADVNGAKKNLAKALSAYTVASMVFSAMTILAGLLLHKHDKYKDEEGEMSAEEIAEAFGKGMLDNFLGSFIFGGEIYEAIDAILNEEYYYGIDASTLETISNIVSNAQKAKKYSQAFAEDALKGSTEAQYENDLFLAKKYGWKLLENAATFAGYPLGNVKKMYDAMELSIEDAVNGEPWGTSKKPTDKDISSQYERMMEALVEGDTKRYEELKEEQIEYGFKEDDKGNPEDTVNNTIKGRITTLLKEGTITGAEAVEMYETAGMSAEDAEKRVQTYFKDQTKDSFQSGSISDTEAMEELVKIGMAEDDAYFQVQQWESGSSSDYGAIYSSIDNALGSGTEANRQAMGDEIRGAIDHGKDGKTIAKQITSKYKSDYLNALENGRAADMKNILITAFMYCGLTRDEAVKKIEGWEK